jgi:Protein of unknown function (DUF2975)
LASKLNLNKVMKTKTERILLIMNILTWMAFIGCVIQAGAILISYGVSTANPVAAKNLYMGMNYYFLRTADFGHYTGIVAFIVFFLVAKAYIAWLVIKVLSRIKLENPFTIEIARRLERISYFIFGMAVMAFAYSAYTEWLSKRFPELTEKISLGDFLFLAGVVFVLAQIFKKGIEIQLENELTV